MPIILIINKLGKVKELNVKSFEESELFKKAGFKNSDGFERHQQWDIELNNEKLSISVYGKTNGRAGQENKYEMPPPIDNTLFFGSLVLVCMDENDNAISIESKKWEKIYETLYGGFEDIGSSEDDEDSELEDEDELLPKTKSGYAKDGFIVDDDEDEDDADYDEEDSEEDEKPNRKKRASSNPTIGKIQKSTSQKKSVFDKIEIPTSIPTTNSIVRDGELTEEEYI
jgi:hypothetical protein